MTYSIIDLTKPPSKEDAAVSDPHLAPPISQSCGITALIVVQDASSVVFDVISAAAGQPFVQQVLIIDNGNSPAITAGFARLEKEIHFVKWIKRSKPTTQAKALNQARSHVTQPYVMILDQYHRLMDNATWRMMVAARLLSNDWLMGVRRQSRTHTALPSCTYLPTPMEAMKQVVGLQSSPAVSVARGSGLQPYYVPAANSACILMPTAVIEDLGWWSEKTTIWGGYSDLCLRLHQRGGNVYYLPEVNVTEIALRKPNMQYQWDSLRGIVDYFNTHYFKTTRLLRWPLSMLLVGSGVLSFCMAVLKTRFAALSFLKK